jgi:putative Ig domain-containing protein
MKRLSAALLVLIVAIAMVGCSGVVSSNATVPQILKVANSSLPGGHVQAFYSATLAATGGTQPYSWSVVAGSLPPGLALGASTGVIAGMPSVSGQYSFTVQVTDPGTLPQSTTQTFAISIAAAGTSPLQITTGGLPSGQVQASYSATLAATGGTQPYSWSVVAGSLPPGLALGASTGVIAGMANVSGQYSFTVQVTDPGPSILSANQTFTISIAAAGASPLQITTSSLPSGQVQASYGTALAATGGTQPYSWSVVAGSLPPGLALDASIGTIAGTPTAAGTFSFTVQVIDSSTPTPQTATASLSASLFTPAGGGVFCGASNFGVSLPNCDPNSPNANTVFDTTMPDTSNYTVVNVGSGGDLQTAINNASCNPNGTIINVAAGATFNSGYGSPVYGNGPYQLPNKSCAAGQWIIVESSAVSGLPATGTRVDYTMTANMPLIQSVGGTPAIVAAPNANHYRFIGLQIAPPTATDTYYLVDMSPEDNTSPPVYGQGASYVIFDRCYVHGNADGAAHQYTHGITLNGSFMAVLDSYVGEFHDTGNDSQAILVWEGGNYKIVDNYLSGAGENVMSGGVVTGGPPPHDFEVRGNHMFKPTAWKGVVSDVKNLFEIKNGVRVLVDGNVLENTWLAGQNGFAILWNLSPGDSASPETLAQETDITFTHNIVRHAAQGMTIANNGGGGSGPFNLLFQNNVFQDINDTTWGDGTQGWWLEQSINGGNTVIDHNTILEVGPSEGAFVAFCSNGVSGTISPWQATNNIINYTSFGILDCDRGLGSGNPAIQSYIPTATLAQNVFINSTSLASNYPSSFLWATPNQTAVGFTNTNETCDTTPWDIVSCALTSTSPYHNAGTDGADIGANIASITSATANAVLPNDGQ